MGPPASCINDLQFLCEATRLSSDKLLTLLEEDFDQIIEAISANDFAQYPISFSMFTKLTIFRETSKTDFSLAEKAYVADCVSIHYPKLFRESHYIVDRKQLTEQDGQYYLVLTGLYPEWLSEKCRRNGAPKLNFYTNLAKIAFDRANQKLLANHIDDWVDILYDVKNKHWR